MGQTSLCAARSLPPTSRRPARPRLSARYRGGSGFLIRFPAMKFVGAVVLYLVIVLLTAYRTMLDEGMDAERIFCLIFGIASMTSLFMVAFLLYRDDNAAAPAVVGKA